MSKQYLRYQHSHTLGVVSGRKSNIVLKKDAGGRRALVVAPSVEDVVIWNPRKGERVSLTSV